MKTKHMPLLLILLFSILLPLSSISANSYSSLIPPLNPPVFSASMIPHDPISILSDDDFEAYNFTGTGNSSDPYMIESLFINTTGIGIEIKSTTKYFVIQYCVIISFDKSIFINGVSPGTATILHNSLESLENSGISIWNGCHESLIKGNIVIAAWTALDLFNCDYSEIIGNHISNSSSGIYIEESSNCLISGNICFDNSGTGILFSFSPYATVDNNLVLYSGEGIATDTGDHSIISNNYCRYNEYGIYAIVTSDLNVFNNTCAFNGDGLRFDGGNDHYVTSNYFYQNSRSGVYFSYVFGSHIQYNTIEENNYYGVMLKDACEDNYVHHNVFLNNIGVSSQAYDDHEQTFPNDWYERDSSEGNYWSDIAGSVYYIDGPGGEIDLYPLNAVTETPPQTTTPSIESTGPETVIISYPYTYLIVIFVPFLATIIKRRERKT